LARDVFDTSVTHVGLVRDVTDTDCWAQNGHTQWSRFRDFQRRLLRIKNQGEKLLWLYLLIPVLSVGPEKLHYCSISGRVRDASSVRFSFNFRS